MSQSEEESESTMNTNQNKATRLIESSGQQSIALDILALKERQAQIEKDYMKMKKEFEEKAAENPAILNKNGRCPFGFGKEFQHQEKMLFDMKADENITKRGTRRDCVPQTSENTLELQVRSIQDAQSKQEKDNAPFIENVVSGQLYTSMLQWNHESQKNPTKTLADLWKEKGGKPINRLRENEHSTHQSVVCLMKQRSTRSVDNFLKTVKTSVNSIKDQNMFALTKKQLKIEKDYMKMKKKLDEKATESSAFLLTNDSVPMEIGSEFQHQHQEQVLMNIMANQTIRKQYERSPSILNKNEGSPIGFGKRFQNQDRVLVKIMENKNMNKPMARPIDVLSGESTVGFGDSGNRDNVLNSIFESPLPQGQSSRKPLMISGYNKYPLTIGSTMPKKGSNPSVNLFELKERMKNKKREEEAMGRRQHLQQMKMICKMTGKMCNPESATE